MSQISNWSMKNEEVMISDPSSGYEIEYITDDTVEYGRPDNNAPASLASDVNNSEEPTVRKKGPIIRRPGEIVTPSNMPSIKAVAVSRLTSNLLPTHDSTVRSRAPLPQMPTLQARRMITGEDATVSLESTHMGQDREVFDHGYAESAVTDIRKYQMQLDRIEKKLDMILEKLYQHDAVFKDIKYSMNDLRVGLKAPVNGPEKVTAEPFVAKSVPALKRKRLVCFPVADDDYLLRLEDLLQADEQIRNEVTMLFKEAPRSSVYDFLRRNIYALFENCSKYTWTGKPSNAMPSMPPANVAGKLALVDHLITCAWDTFPHLNREAIAKDFRRALCNFNDAVYTKRRKRKEMKLQNTGQINDSDANADADLS